MSVDMAALAEPRAPIQVTWTPEDVLLYALSVGAGEPDPTESLHLTTENTAGRPLTVLPSFAALLASRTEPAVPGDLAGTTGLHAGQSVDLVRPLEPQGSVDLVWSVTHVFDRPAGVVVVQSAVATDRRSGHEVFTATSTSFIVGARSGRDGAAPKEPGPPDREPDLRRVVRTRLDQALLYRLTGDRNPLHSDPAVASSSGFGRPILHGMCTYGIAARVLAQEAFGDPCAVSGMSARFTAPVWPGDTLYLEGWVTSDQGVRFRVRRTDGDVVIDRGRLERSPAREGKAHGQQPIGDA